MSPVDIANPEHIRLKQLECAYNDLRALLPKGPTYDFICRQHAIVALTLLLVSNRYTMENFPDTETVARVFIDEHFPEGSGAHG